MPPPCTPWVPRPGPARGGGGGAFSARGGSREGGGTRRGLRGGSGGIFPLPSPDWSALEVYIPSPLSWGVECILAVFGTGGPAQATLAIALANVGKFERAEVLWAELFDRHNAQ
eukprot:9488031-Pyramimonas_sp.AAC.2